MIAYGISQQSFSFGVHSNAVMLPVLTWCTTIWIDIDEWRLFNVFETDRLDFVGKLKLL